MDPLETVSFMCFILAEIKLKKISGVFLVPIVRFFEHQKLVMVFSIQITLIFLSVKSSVPTFARQLTGFRKMIHLFFFFTWDSLGVDEEDVFQDTERINGQRSRRRLERKTAIKHLSENRRSRKAYFLLQNRKFQNESNFLVLYTPKKIVELCFYEMFVLYNTEERFKMFSKHGNPIKRYSEHSLELQEIYQQECVEEMDEIRFIFELTKHQVSKIFNKKTHFFQHIPRKLTCIPNYIKHKGRKAAIERNEKTLPTNFVPSVNLKIIITRVFSPNINK